jgi:hypothetical protein
MGVQFYWLVLGVLSVWRVTHLLNAEDGPWNLVVWLRQRAGSGFWAGLMDCFYCLSLWIAAPVAYLIGSHWRERFFLWLALSAGAILVERVAPEKTVPPVYGENEHSEDGCRERQEVSHVLRQESTAASDPDAFPDSRSGPSAPTGA